MGDRRTRRLHPRRVSPGRPEAGESRTRRSGGKLSPGRREGVGGQRHQAWTTAARQPRRQEGRRWRRVSAGEVRGSTFETAAGADVYRQQLAGAGWEPTAQVLAGSAREPAEQGLAVLAREPAAQGLDGKAREPAAQGLDGKEREPAAQGLAGRHGSRQGRAGPPWGSRGYDGAVQLAGAACGTGKREKLEIYQELAR
jgi:hypothetical protein